MWSVGEGDASLDTGQSRLEPPRRCVVGGSTTNLRDGSRPLSVSMSALHSLSAPLASAVTEHQAGHATKSSRIGAD
jgi:hypothetical protein